MEGTGLNYCPRGECPGVFINALVNVAMVPLKVPQLSGWASPASGLGPQMPCIAHLFDSLFSVVEKAAVATGLGMGGNLSAWRGRGKQNNRGEDGGKASAWERGCDWGRGYRGMGEGVWGLCQASGGGEPNGKVPCFQRGQSCSFILILI